MASASASAASPKPKVVAREPTMVKSFVSGGFGGACLVFVGHPLDLIKTRLQTMVVKPGQAPMYTGALDCARKTIKFEGVRGLYKGMSAPLTGVTPMWALNFLAYDGFVKVNRAVMGTQEHEETSLLQCATAGAMAAVPTTLITSPGDRVKCILATQDTLRINGAAAMPKYNGMFDVVRDLYATGGIRSIYRGFNATLARDAAGSVLYFSVYEGIKRALSKDGTKLSPLAVMCGGGLAGMANWSVSIPIDTVKSRIQTFPAGTYTGMADCARKLIAEEGAATLFRGFGPVMLRAFPANAACFMGREVALKFMDWMGDSEGVLPGEVVVA